MCHEVALGLGDCFKGLNSGCGKRASPGTAGAVYWKLEMEAGNWGQDVLLSNEESTAMLRDRTDFNRLPEIDMVVMSVSWDITKPS